MNGDKRWKVQSFKEPPPRLFGEIAARYTRALLRGRRRQARSLVFNLLELGADARDIYLGLLQQSQQEIGRLWQANQISVADEHLCTAATRQIMAELGSRVAGADALERTIILTCVAGEQHDLGIQMVADFFEMEGWSTQYLGANLPTQAIVTAVKEREPDVIGLSATMPQNLDQFSQLISAVRDAQGEKKVIILVGGRPFNLAPNLWRKLGADGTGGNARQAVATAQRILESRPDVLPRCDTIPLQTA